MWPFPRPCPPHPPPHAADGAAEESELPRLLVESEMRTEEKLRQLGRVCLLNAALGAEPGICLFK